MTLEEVLIVMQNRVISLKTARTSSVNSGDLDSVIKIDNDLITTMSSIEKIKDILNSGV